MNTEKTDPGRPSIAFDDWKLRLRHDCEQQGQLRAFDAISDSVHRLFWKRGLAPTMKAIVNDGTELLRLPR